MTIRGKHSPIDSRRSSRLYSSFSIHTSPPGGKDVVAFERVVAAGGEEDDPCVLIDGADLFGDLHAGHARHVDVKEDEVVVSFLKIFLL